MSNIEYSYYTVDVEVSALDESKVYATLDTDLIKCSTFEDAKAFAAEYAKDLSHFDFDKISDIEDSCYEVTVRGHYIEDDYSGWDDIDSYTVENPDKSIER